MPRTAEKMAVRPSDWNMDNPGRLGHNQYKQGRFSLHSLAEGRVVDISRAACPETRAGLEGEKGMSITPNVPPSSDRYAYEPSPTTPWIPLLVVVLFLGLGAVLYVGYTSRAQLQNALAQGDSHADVLSKELEQTNSRVALLRAQLDVTSQKLGLTQAELARARGMAQQIQQEQQDSDAKLIAQIGQVQQESETRSTSVDRSNRSQNRYRRDQKGFGRHQEEPHHRGRRLEQPGSLDRPQW